MILAGIDIGTNTLRLLIADVAQGTFRELYSDRRITRLGRELDRTGVLAREAEDSALHVLREFSESIRRHAAAHTAAVGTSALRKASNASAFTATAERTMGLAITVISGQEEARLTLRGVIQSLRESEKSGDRSCPIFVVDIGGGSTEIIMGRPAGEPLTVSLGLGAVYLTERFLGGDPPSSAEVERMRSSIRKTLSEQSALFQPSRTSLVVGTAGTVTTLAAVAQGLEHYDPGKINEYVLTREFIDDLVPELCALTVKERRSIRGLDPGREDIILAGAVVLQEIMRQYSCASMVVSDWGLREGIVLDLYDRITESAYHATVPATNG